MSISSLVVGIVSLVFGFTFVVPLTGLILGVVARGKEPAGRTVAGWGIALNLIALLAWLVVSMILFTTGFIEGVIHPHH